MQTAVTQLKELDPAIPLLSEVLETVPPGKKVFLEIKCGPEAVPRLIQDIANSKLVSDQVVTISFNESVVRDIKKQAPEIEACWLVNRKRAGLAIRPSLEEMLSIAKEIGADGIGIKSNRNFTRKIARGILEAGLGLHVWTVDNPKEAIKYHRWGVQSLTTNRPGYMKQFIPLE